MRRACVHAGACRVHALGLLRVPSMDKAGCYVDRALTLLLASHPSRNNCAQVCKMILKIDDVIKPSEYD